MLIAAAGIPETTWKFIGITTPKSASSVGIYVGDAVGLRRAASGGTRGFAE